MRRLVYASASSAALTSAELDEIASQARKNNAADDVTGLLLYGDHSFFQVLEGPTDRIEKLKQRIWNDPRHRGISSLQDKTIDTATFSEWSMGCYRVDAASSSSELWIIADFTCVESHLPENTPPEILVLARTFFSSISPRSMMPGTR